MSDEPEGTVWEPLMPFVVCQSKGGPYEDEAFAAGYALGDLAACIADPRIQCYAALIRTALVPQCDLLAMMHAYEVTSEVWDEDPEWSNVTFTRGGIGGVS